MPNMEKNLIIYVEKNRMLELILPTSRNLLCKGDTIKSEEPFV